MDKILSGILFSATSKITPLMLSPDKLLTLGMTKVYRDSTSGKMKSYHYANNEYLFFFSKQ